MATRRGSTVRKANDEELLASFRECNASIRVYAPMEEVGRNCSKITPLTHVAGAPYRGHIAGRMGNVASHVTQWLIPEGFIGFLATCRAPDSREFDHMHVKRGHF